MSYSVAAIFNDGASALGTSIYSAGQDDVGLVGTFGVSPIAFREEVATVRLIERSDAGGTGVVVFVAGLVNIGIVHGQGARGDIFPNTTTVHKQRGNA